MKQIIVFAVVENSEGDREIVHYEMSVSQRDYDNGDHYLAACQKAEREGYRVFVSFDSNDMAGKQLLGKSMLYGDKGCYIASLPNSKVGEVLNEAADIMEAHLVHGEVSEEAFNEATEKCREASGNCPQYIRVEYDTLYTGGNYEGVGNFVYIPESLVEQAARACEKDGIKEDPVHFAFRKQTHMDSMHIIHYSSEERYTEDGELISN